jgi:nitrile hydratase subunit beta
LPEAGTAPRYATGARVRVRAVDPDHHTRMPRYVRGHAGEIVDDHGAWPLADDRARGLAAPRVETVYAVRFAARDLWGSGGHTVTVDLWESYLEPC